MSILTHKGMHIIVQGITGREASNFVRDSLDYGMKIIAGVTPGKKGIDIHGVPVYNCIREIKDRIDCTIISVPAPFARDAALEAIENGIGLVVIVTERIPRRDVVEFITLAKEKNIKVIGPNTLGIISPDEAKIGMIGGPPVDVRKSYKKGNIGIVSRSGGMTTEIANLLTQEGFGQSTCVSIGGDFIVGTGFTDLIPLFCKDPQTHAVVIYCEPGGLMEEELADYLRNNPVSLPIVAFISGRFVDEMQGVRFGHAAVMVEGKKGSTAEKIGRFKEAGIHVAEELTDIPKILKGRDAKGTVPVLGLSPKKM